MLINLSPIRDDRELAAIVTGDAIDILGITYDFTQLPEGAILPREAVNCPWLASDVRRIDGEIVLTLIFPHGPIPWPAPPESRVVTFPEPIHMTEDGPVPFPTYTPPPDVPLIDPEVDPQLEVFEPQLKAFGKVKFAGISFGGKSNE